MIFKIIKRIIFALLIIYSFDLFIRNLDIFIPLNIYTVSAVSILGFPGLISLALSFFFLL